MDRRRGAWQIGAGFALTVLVLAVYKVDWVDRWVLHGHLESQLRSLAHGTYAAPYQYRVLVPVVEYVLATRTALGFLGATMLVDTVALLAGVALLYVLLRRSGLADRFAVAMVHVALWGIAAVSLAKPETFTAFAMVNAAVIAFLWPERCWSGVLRWTSAAVLALSRPELVLVVAVLHLVRWWTARSPVDLRRGVALAATSLGATLTLMTVYAGARYNPGNSTFQLGHNLRPSTLLPVLCWFALPLGPALAGRVRRLSTDERLLLLGLGVSFAMACVTGMIDEIRLFFPTSGALSLIGVRLWFSDTTAAAPVGLSVTTARLQPS